MPDVIDPIQPTDDNARALARELIDTARYAALAVRDPVTGEPQVTRIALGTTPDGLIVTLISALAAHTVALRADPRAGLLVGEPGPKGDPLTHPRLSLTARARFVARDTDEDAAIRAHYLATHPKAKLYAAFADFSFVVFELRAGALNGGFGQAFRLSAEDLAAAG